MKRLLICAAALATAFAGSAMAQSAKFTAVYADSYDGTFVRSEACQSYPDNSVCGALGAGDDATALAGFATIRVPQSKELLVGLSAQVALGTITEAKGKRGSRSMATAFAEGGVTLYACETETTNSCYEGKPGFVILSNRNQELEAILGGVIENCDVTVVLEGTTWEDATASGSFKLSDCSVLDESISLGISTLAAHHFNFVFPDLPQGDYDIIAKFETQAAATATASCAYESDDLGCRDGEIDDTLADAQECEDLGGYPVLDITEAYDYCLFSSGSATASAYAYIGKWMMTVQTVRAVKDEDTRGGIVEIDY